MIKVQCLGPQKSSCVQQGKDTTPSIAQQPLASGTEVQNSHRGKLKDRKKDHCKKSIPDQLGEPEPGLLFLSSCNKHWGGWRII